MKTVVHQGQYRSVSLAKQRFFWLNMEHRIRDHVRHCQRCIVSKSADPSGRAPLENISTTRPLELVCIRAVVKSTFVESKTSPSPKRFESESSPSPKRFESESSPSPKRFESKSKSK